MTLRMKLYKAIRFLTLPGILALLLSGCLRESLEGCPLDVLLRFTYKPQGSAADLFGERVQRVTLCVFRPDGSIEHTQTLEKGELDRLLFAATPLSVSEHDATANRTVNFSPATMRVSVLLEGISVKPVVRIAGMASALLPKRDEDTGAWKAVPVEQGKTFVPEVAYDAAGRHAEAVADMPRFRADTPGTVEIIDPATGNLIVPPVSIAELIARYGIPLEGDIEVTIPIEIAFGAGHTRITVKGWESHNVKPGGV